MERKKADKQKQFTNSFPSHKQQLDEINNGISAINEQLTLLTRQKELLERQLYQCKRAFSDKCIHSYGEKVYSDMYSTFKCCDYCTEQLELTCSSWG